MTEPPADEQLRDAALTATAYLRIDSARQYGLITGGPEINVARCEQIIQRAHTAGHVWTENETEQATFDVIRAWT